MTADQIKRMDDIGFNWDASRRSVVIQPNMSLGLIVINRYVDQSRRLVVVKVNDNSILKGKVFPGDCIFRVQVVLSTGKTKSHEQSVIRLKEL